MTTNNPVAFNTKEELLEFSNNNDYNVKGSTENLIKFIKNNAGKFLYLKGADLWNADLQGADLGNANLENANFEDADLWNADLLGANLQGADLQGADLGNANLENANFEDADLWKANFENANLWNADLAGANLGDTKGVYCLSTEYYNIYFHEQQIQIGCKTHTLEEWENFTDDDIDKMEGKKALLFWKKYKDTVFSLYKKFFD